MAHCSGHHAREFCDGDILDGAAGDFEGLAREAKKLAAMTEGEREAMGRKGRDVSVTEFDRDTQIDKLEAWLLGLRYDDHSKVIEATQ
jgi:hypothetical protein